MTIPTIHGNGTSRGDLEKQVTDAAHAIRDAQDVLRHAAPNGRDYYPQGPEVFEQARNEHDARQAKLAEVYDELVELYEGIYKAGK